MAVGFIDDLITMVECWCQCGYVYHCEYAASVEKFLSHLYNELSL